MTTLICTYKTWPIALSICIQQFQMAEKKSNLFIATHNSQMEQSRTKWASMLAFIEDVVDHLPEWSDEGSDDPLNFTELWLNRIHECHKFNNLLNAIKNLREEVDMLKNKVR